MATEEQEDSLTAQRVLLPKHAVECDCDCSPEELEQSFQGWQAAWSEFDAGSSPSVLRLIFKPTQVHPVV